MKTSELTGAQLDYWVAKAEGRKCKIDKVFAGPNHGQVTCQVWVDPTEAIHGYNVEYFPSTNYLHGGPIIEQEKIAVVPNGEGWDAYYAASYSGPDGQVDSRLPVFEAPTYLAAAMRAYVASVFGEQVPDE